MATVLESNKAKIAKRVIEVFEFFNNDNRHATVMDIVRQYDRPQSSTSELLASLVEMGLLYKDPRSRTYTPTPRLATLGSGAQPDIIRNGQLFAFMDRLSQSSRHGVGLFGMVGTHMQIFRWAAGAYPLSSEMACGMAERLSDNTPGQLLLSTLATEAAGRILRRLNSEAAEVSRFSYPDVLEQVSQYRRNEFATGEAGFASNALVTAVLVPRLKDERPLAVGVVYPKDSVVDAAALVTTIQAGLAVCRTDWTGEVVPLPSLMRAV